MCTCSETFLCVDTGSYLYWDDLPSSYQYTAIVQQGFKIMQHLVSGALAERASRRIDSNYFAISLVDTNWQWPSTLVTRKLQVNVTSLESKEKWHSLFQTFICNEEVSYTCGIMFLNQYLRYIMEHICIYVLMETQLIYFLLSSSSISVLCLFEQPPSTWSQVCSSSWFPGWLLEWNRWMECTKLAKPSTACTECSLEIYSVVYPLSKCKQPNDMCIQVAYQGITCSMGYHSESRWLKTAT